MTGKALLSTERNIIKEEDISPKTPEKRKTVNVGLYQWWKCTDPSIQAILTSISAHHHFSCLRGAVAKSKKVIWGVQLVSMNSNCTVRFRFQARFQYSSFV